MIIKKDCNSILYVVVGAIVMDGNINCWACDLWVIIIDYWSGSEIRAYRCSGKFVAPENYSHTQQYGLGLRLRIGLNLGLGLRLGVRLRLRLGLGLGLALVTL